ncbi:MAG: 50S ribosomal protein L17 [Cytophagales bacterium]|nr:MAG: 50S ribosomal protein L17 [Cytophagales bacterium]
MRHGKKINHLGRTSQHRQALLSNMASSLILSKRITTTLAKAKALKKYVEPLLTKSKDDTTHSRRMVFSYLQNKESVDQLFSDVAVKIASRPGGYTRIIRIGNRLGDNAEMCIMELVDYNTIYGNKSSAPAKPKTRRSRKSTGTVTNNTAPSSESASEAADETSPVTE